MKQRLKQRGVEIPRRKEEEKKKRRRKEEKEEEEARETLRQSG